MFDSLFEAFLFYGVFPFFKKLSFSFSPKLLSEFIHGFFLCFRFVIVIFFEFRTKTSERSELDKFGQILLLFSEQFLLKNIIFESAKTSFSYDFVLQI